MMTLTQTGNQVEGKYTLEDGHVAGTVSGNVLNGKWDEAPRQTAHDRGPFQFTMSGDGQSFTGTWGHDDTGPYPDPWNGTCASGACKQNGTAPPPTQPTRCPGAGTATFAQTTAPFICNTGEPGPGGSTRVSSPTLAPGDKNVTVGVGSSAGNLNGTTIVGEAEPKRPRSQKIGEAVAACWLIGTEAFDYPPHLIKAAMNEIVEGSGRSDPTPEEIARRIAAVMGDPEARLYACMLLARRLTEYTDPPSISAAGGCNTQRIAIKPRTRRGRIVGLKFVKRQRPRRSSVRYRCKIENGTATITVRRRKSLRKAVGKKLDLGAVRAPKASARQATLTFGFF
jgi:hypothetical protein